GSPGEARNVCPSNSRSSVWVETTVPCVLPWLVFHSTVSPVWKVVMQSSSSSMLGAASEVFDLLLLHPGSARIAAPGIPRDASGAGVALVAAGESGSLGVVLVAGEVVLHPLHVVVGHRFSSAQLLRPVMADLGEARSLPALLDP